MKKYLFVGMALLLMSCQSKSTRTLSNLNPTKFVKNIDSIQNQLYTLKNKNGMEVCVTNFGGRIVSIMVLDKNGKMRDVTLGFDNIDDYENIPSDFGASIGRYANRINKGQFKLDGKLIQLPTNNFGHCLHGGPKGWQYQMYSAKQTSKTCIELTRLSPDGDQNFPGKVIAKVIYTLTADNAIDIKYSATTDKPTIINMTQHSYFNLNGNPSHLSTNNFLYINADYYTPIDSTFMPYGNIETVKDTPMDFTTPKELGKDINANNQQIKNANGYDHNWVLNTKGDITKLAARLSSPETGITLSVYTTEPGIQVYSSNFLDGSFKGKNGITYKQHASVCLETQHYPNSPNIPEWPSTVLLPGDTYYSECIYKFGLSK